MNKKCGNCGWRSDKCKNPNNIHYNQFRDEEDRCSGNIKNDKKYVLATTRHKGDNGEVLYWGKDGKGERHGYLTADIDKAKLYSEEDVEKNPRNGKIEDIKKAKYYGDYYIEAQGAE